MTDSKANSGWVAGFFILLVCLIVSVAWGVSTHSQKTKLSKELNAANTSLSQITSSNAQSQQSCIATANRMVNVDPYIADSLQSRVNACEAQYPTN
jgi:hypothetical protein